MPKQTDEGTVRLSFDLPNDLHSRFVEQIPWGIRSQFIRKLIELALNRVENFGPAVLGAVLMGEFDVLGQPMREEGKDGQTN